LHVKENVNFENNTNDYYHHYIDRLYYIEYRY